MSELSRETVEAVLERGRIYEVGGAVRDRLLYHRPSAYDRDYVVTGIEYDDLSRILRRHGQVNLVGRSFGVIKFTQPIDGKPHTFDITLPRTEHSTGAGHRDFEVTYDASLSIEADLVRRDFTVNAMAYELGDDVLIDPLDGQADLRNKTLRMVYPESFRDDPLRMMRAIQFAARFDFTIEPQTFAAMQEQAPLITTVSAERIADEFRKLMERAEKPSIGLRLMERSGLLEQVLPELEACVGVDQPGPFHAYDVFEHTLKAIDACPMEFRVRMAALFHDINKPQSKRLVDRDGEPGATFYGHEVQGARTARRVMERLRFSRELTRQVVTLVERHMFTTDVTPKGMRRLVRRVGVPLIFDLLDLRRADVAAQGMGGKTDDVDQFEREIRDELDRKPPFSLRDLVLHGDDIMRLFSIPAGREVGVILDYLMEQVLDDPANNTEEKLTALAREYYESLSLTDRSNDKETDL